MKVEYAILPRRVKAVFVDTIILVAAMYAVSEVFNLLGETPNAIRIIAFLVIFLCYDPFFTSQYGGTIGHSFSKISVRTENDINKTISFPVAVVRYILKAILGWYSLLTVTGNKKKKAVHDFVAKSVVIEVN